MKWCSNTYRELENRVTWLEHELTKTKNDYWRLAATTHNLLIYLGIKEVQKPAMTVFEPIEKKDGI